MTLGEHAHFCVDKNHSPIEIIELLNNSENGFREWLSTPFSCQFNQVLSTAIEKKYLDIIEVLLDGRRCVTSSYTENCFVNSKKKISELTKELVALEVDSEFEKPVLDDIKAIEDIINEERKNEVHLTIGSKKENLNITKDGIHRGDK
ncbi:hypothetical protein HWV03_04760 [Moritella sp. 36]|uniref:hypothetical protein n=1 Tax=Moritella sp. 36 TaxID=2746233 RepID=UPI001BAA8EAA|nr:hypothetical protein [Moritella sp. 36]QUM88184.1 hypothetical protein HWV03_04760 [Moritella sp. 36]